MNHEHAHPEHSPTEGQRTTTHRDPVCGMQVNPAKAAATAYYGGKEYFFCGRSCHKKFTEAPEKYVNPNEKPTDESQASHGHEQPTYTCPMHPEVRQSGPGICPKCGM